MKNTKIKAMAVTAIISAVMLTGCSDIVTEPSTTSADTKITISADSKMETGVPMSLESSPEIKPVSKKKDASAEVQKAAADKQEEAVRIAEEAKKADDTRKAEAAKKAEEARKAEEAKKAEKAKEAEDAKKAEEAKKAEQSADTQEKDQALTAAPEEENTSMMGGVPTGEFFDANGSRVFLSISSLSDGTYFCTVRMADCYNSGYIYSFICNDNGSGLEYVTGDLSIYTFDDEGTEDMSIISEGHSGTIIPSGDYLVWTDIDGSAYSFTK